MTMTEQEKHDKKMRLLDAVTQSLVNQDGEIPSELMNVHIIDKLLDKCVEMEDRLDNQKNETV